MDDPAGSHPRGITEATVRDWFRGLYDTHQVQGNGGRRGRFMYVFEDLPTA